MLMLYYYEDLNLRETGELMGVVESRVCRRSEPHGLPMETSREHLPLSVYCRLPTSSSRIVQRLRIPLPALARDPPLANCLSLFF